MYSRPRADFASSGVERYDVDLEQKRVTIEGRGKLHISGECSQLTQLAPPSVLLSALKGTQRQVVVRGAGPALGAPGAGESSAAIAIFESPIPPASSVTPSEEFTQQVFGLSRFIQIAPKLSLLDLTLKVPMTAGMESAQYEIYVASTGDVSNPPASTGAPTLPLGKVSIDAKGYGDLFKELPGEVWEWIGRGCVARRVDGGKEGSIYAGVIARSSGAWGNDKTVCACSGRTMWEEGREWAAKGV